MRKIVLIGMLLLAFATQAFAQFPPRVEDHFWRRKVVNVIDLDEKINQPLIKQESPYYRTEDTDNGYADKDGIIATLFGGLKAGKYKAWNPDTLTTDLSWEDVIDKINAINADVAGEADLGFDEGEGDGGFETFEGEGEEDSDDFFDDGFGDTDLFGDLPEDDMTETTGDDESQQEEDPGVGSAYNEMPDLIPFSRVIHFVEDRIFDKNRSDMVYDIQFIEVVWVDPNDQLPSRRLCTFRYKDVMDALEQTQWKNRFNDAEYRNLREVFEARMFHSYIIDISGQGITSLEEAEYRRHQLVEFEHHLWSY